MDQSLLCPLFRNTAVLLFACLALVHPPFLLCLLLLASTPLHLLPGHHRALSPLLHLRPAMDSTSSITPETAVTRCSSRLLFPSLRSRFLLLLILSFSTLGSKHTIMFHSIMPTIRFLQLARNSRTQTASLHRSSKTPLPCSTRLLLETMPWKPTQPTRSVGTHGSMRRLIDAC